MGLLQKNGDVIRHIDMVWLTEADIARLITPLADVERRAIESAMILCRGDFVQASSRLGIDISTLRRKVRRYREQDGDYVSRNRVRAVGAGR